MSEQYEMPEATRSAMAASTGLRVEADRADPPVAAVDRFVHPIETLIKKDPDVNQAFLDLTAELNALRSSHSIDMDTLRDRPEQLLYREGAAAAPFRIREAPFDYAAKDGRNASMTPNATRGALPVIGKAGFLKGAQGDAVGGRCWTGIRVTNESVGSQPNERVRISALVKWWLFWDLIVAGLPDGLLGSDPWANCRVGIRMTAWDELGRNVADTGDRELFFRHHSAAPGLTPNKVSGAESGTSFNERVFFNIPHGKARWVNVDAYFMLRTRYASVFNVAAAIGSYHVDVLSFVMRPAGPGE